MPNPSVEEATVLESLSLSKVFQAFKQVLGYGDDFCLGPQVRFGTFKRGDPLCIQFYFTYSYNQQQLYDLLAVAAQMGLRMEPLRFEEKELVFTCRTKLLQP